MYVLSWLSISCGLDESRILRRSKQIASGREREKDREKRTSAKREARVVPAFRTLGVYADEFENTALAEGMDAFLDGVPTEVVRRTCGTYVVNKTKWRLTDRASSPCTASRR